ncbi:hypothetical protein U9M48_041365 [Paspalum notatum var. saurae]|uniref:Uncharacterized protein n=1 Tax=Paspalum notatum var. saurae TaxID=547442 RepID=A0AAQ3XD96_PASNO
MHGAAVQLRRAVFGGAAKGMTSSMAWYPLPRSGGAMAAGDEFFDNQTAGWSLWSFCTSDDQNTAGTAAYSERHEKDGDARCGSTGPSEEDRSPAPLQEPRFTQTQPTDEIFLSQFSDEEMRRMDGPFEALDMFPDSMHRLLSYENMLTGALTGSEEGDATMLERNGVDTLDTCGFPLFSHDLPNESRNAEQRNPEMMLEEGKDGPSMAKRSRPIADTESTPGFEALVLLEELEDAVFQLTKRTRICYRDAFYRLAESSKANCSTANGNYSASRQKSFQQPNGNASRVSKMPFIHLSIGLLCFFPDGLEAVSVQLLALFLLLLLTGLLRSSSPSSSSSSSRLISKCASSGHPDSANEGPTQKQSRTQWPEDEPVHPVPEDGVSLIKSSLFQGVAWGKASQPGNLTITTKDDYGGLEVILDVYFPPHVTSL